MKIAPITPDFAAAISDIDLSQPLTAEQVTGIARAIAKYAVLIFRDQPLTDDQHAAFARNFGPIDKGLLLGSKRKRRLANADVIDLANLDLE
ncbi:MAG: TauD/TfdA family dioxygenase, partial [Alphaproteobacteria bacterium]|nr:TauD/TfdA family dioxygenase [Alphaproteobacteria bacterium]